MFFLRVYTKLMCCIKPPTSGTKFKISWWRRRCLNWLRSLKPTFSFMKDRESDRISNSISSLSQHSLLVINYNNEHPHVIPQSILWSSEDRWNDFGFGAMTTRHWRGNNNNKAYESYSIRGIDIVAAGRPLPLSGEAQGRWWSRIF